MEQQSRRGLFKNAAKAAFLATGGAIMSKSAHAQVSGALEKKSYPANSPPRKIPTPRSRSIRARSPMATCSSFPAPVIISRELSRFIPRMFSRIRKEIGWRRIFPAEGAEGQCVPQRSQDYDAMNKVYSAANWGDVPPVRTTVSPAGGIPGNSLVEIDMIAYI